MTLTPNQIKRVQLIQKAIFKIQCSSEFKSLDYHPDLTLGDAAQAIEELLEEHNANQPYLRLTISKPFDWRKLLINANICFSLIGGFSALLGLGATTMHYSTKNRMSDTVTGINWELVSKRALQISVLGVSGAIAGTLALHLGNLESKKD